MMHHVIEESEAKVADVAIVDRPFEETLFYMDTVKESKILWMVTVEDYAKAIIKLGSINIGKRIAIMVKSNSVDQRLCEMVDQLLTPSYPVKRPSMDIFIPVFNESIRAKEIRAFVQTLLDIQAHGYPDLQVYFINDGSNDDSHEMLESIAAMYEINNEVVDASLKIQMVDLDHNTKKAGTYIEAFRMTQSDYMLFIDADNAFEQNDIIATINVIEQGYYDIIIASKDIQAENRPAIRRFMSFVKRQLTRPLLPKGVADSQTGLKLFTHEVAKHVVSDLDESYRFAIDLKILHVAKKLGYRVFEQPVQFHEKGNSHIDIVADSIAFLYNIGRIMIGR